MTCFWAYVTCTICLLCWYVGARLYSDHATPHIWVRMWRFGRLQLAVGRENNTCLVHSYEVLVSKSVLCALCVLGVLPISFVGLGRAFGFKPMWGSIRGCISGQPYKYNHSLQGLLPNICRMGSGYVGWLYIPLVTMNIPLLVILKVLVHPITTGVMLLYIQHSTVSCI